jgi:general secretion pathway protein I
VRAARGFTLIEVLVALAIVAIGMAAVLESLTSSANTTMFLQDKTFAGWVALNRIETVRLSGTVPEAGTSNDDISYAGQSWEWQQKVTNTQIPGMVQIEVDVKPADSTAGDDRGWYASAIGFMSNAIAPPTNPPSQVWSANPIDTLPTGIPGQTSTTTTTPTTSTPTQ